MGLEQAIARTVELLWMGAIAATPLAVVVSLICRARRVRPATRHMLWFAVLASFITPAVGSLIWRPQWFSSERVMAAAGVEAASEQAAAEVVAPAGGVASSPVSEVAAPPLIAGEKVGPGRVAASRIPAVLPVPALWNAMPMVEFCAGLLANERAADTRIASQSSTLAESAEFVGPVPVRTASPRIAPALSVAASSRVTPAPMASTSKRASGESGASQSTEGVTARVWLARLLKVRDAVAELPPLPPAVWFGGAVLVVVLSLWRRFMAMLWLRDAAPAGPAVQCLVRQVAAALGLSRVPRVVFVNAAVSPMIWCGLRPLLVLPTSLWRTLDEDSRRAVLVHELAHVRRWDHLLCWVTAGIGALYWWHPVVWWVRRRLHEEAEASCDTWVTSLFPTQRRAYASALVVTKSFVSSRAASRGPWLGVASGSAKRLARRITMVMTHKSAPRMSMLGVFVTALIVATGTFVMPGLACPPEDEAKARSKAEQAAQARSRTAVTPRAPEPGVVFFGEAPALEAMRGGGAAVAPTPPAPPELPRQGSPARAPKAPKPPKAPKAPKAVQGVSVAPMAAPRAEVSVDLDALKEAREPREYRLSQGKLQAFYGMMSRSDVPILVEMKGDRMVIWGNDDEHAVFGRFVRIVDGDGQQSRVAAPARVAGQNKVLAERLAQVEGQRAREAGTRAAQEALKARGQALTRDLEAEREARTRMMVELEADRARVDAAREGNQELRERIQALQAQIRELEKRAEKLEGGREDQRPSRRPASPGMVSPASSTTGGGVCGSPCQKTERACETTCESPKQTASR
ncbi:MAG TPA: M56 family metallopeptidase [Phycisphaerales bacterium]|nr:M56 family metallopeptidase [Phycisphaerales bacterium]